MKIKTITCSNADNHGARIQTFALARFLSDEGHEVEVIDYRPDYMRFNMNKWYFPGSDIKEWVKLLVRYRQRCVAIRRHEAFDSFSRSHIPLTARTYFSYDQLVENPPEADVYIAGSDQIWNVDFHNGNDRAFFLDFGDKNTRRLSYAASFALPALPREKEAQIAGRLSKLDAISVRESSGVDILRRLGLDGTRVVDPVFLLGKDFWHKFAGTAGTGRKYLLVYDFMQCDTVRAVAKEIARSRQLEIVSVGPYPLEYADRNLTVCSPETFVRLIRDADCVLSNSFHATAFSLIFEKDFFVTEREDGLNERMRDLLSSYGLDDNIVSANRTASISLRHTAYDHVTPAIHTDTEASKAWLRNALASRPPS